MENLPQKLLNYMNSNMDRELLNGYLRIIDETKSPEYTKLLSKWDEWEGGIPFASTAFGQILVWHSNFVYKYDLIDNVVTVILSGFDFFFQNIEDKEYQKDFFELELYEKCKTKLGKIGDDECYIYVPVPSLGGSKSFETIEKGKILEYLYILVDTL